MAPKESENHKATKTRRAGNAASQAERAAKKLGDLAAGAGSAMRAVFGPHPREARFAVVELALMALADNGPLEASSREMDNFEALAGDDPESLLAAVNKTVLWESLDLPGNPSPENLREWADQLVSLTIHSYPLDELSVPL